MPTIVGILTSMSRIHFVLSWVEHGKSFINSGPDLDPKYFALCISEIFIFEKISFEKKTWLLNYPACKEIYPQRKSELPRPIAWNQTSDVHRGSTSITWRWRYITWCLSHRNHAHTITSVTAAKAELFCFRNSVRCMVGNFSRVFVVVFPSVDYLQN